MAQLKSGSTVGANAIVDTTDSRLSDSRTSNNSFDNSTTARSNLGLGALATSNTVSDAQISGMSASKLSGALPAIDGSSLTGMGGGLVDTQKFTASGTWTKPSGCNSVIIIAIGSGGKGGNGGNGDGNSGGGSGGGGGAYAYAWVDNPPATVAITCGSAQNSSFGTYVTAGKGATGETGHNSGHCPCPGPTDGGTASLAAGIIGITMRGEIGEAGGSNWNGAGGKGGVPSIYGGWVNPSSTAASTIANQTFGTGAKGAAAFGSGIDGVGGFVHVEAYA